MTETDAKQRLVELLDPSPDCGLLGDEPGMLRFLPRLHGPAEHEEYIEALEIGDRVAAIELENRRRKSIGCKVLAESAERTEGCVLEGEHTQCHLFCSTAVSSRTSRSDRPAGDPDF